MKRKLFGLVMFSLIMTLFLVTPVQAKYSLTEEEKESIKTSGEVAKEYFLKAKLPSKKAFQKIKPTIASAEFQEEVWSPGGAWKEDNLRITFNPLPGYEDYVDVMLPAGFHGYELQVSKSLNGKFEDYVDELYWYDGCHWSTPGACPYFAQLIFEDYGVYYVRFRYFYYVGEERIYTQYSDPVEGRWIPTPSYLCDAGVAGKNKIVVEFYKEKGFGRNLQVRKKGSKKWVNVSKSSLVKKYKLTDKGYTLTMDTSKEYEFRSRYYLKKDGKTYYGKEKIHSEMYNPDEKPTDVTFLRYNSGDAVVLRWNRMELYDDDKEISDYGGYQVVRRKIGSGDKWQVVDTTYSIDNNGLAWCKADIGYEYKVRPYLEMIEGNIAYGPYSKAFKCTEETAKFVNNMGVDTGRWDYSYLEDPSTPVLGRQYDSRPVYDYSESIESNYNVIRPFVCIYYERLFDNGLALNSNGPFYTVKVDRSKADEGKVGVFVMGMAYFDGGAILELMNFFSGDTEIANALYCWLEASSDYGTANSDYFGFRDVKSTANGFIIEMKGHQIEVENRGKEGTIYWFDMNK